MRIAIDRPQLESLLIEACSRLLGLPVEKVFINDFASDTAAPERPFVSLRIGPAQLESQRGTVQYQPGIESWRFQVMNATDGPFSVTVDGVSHTHVAASQTITQIRNSLAALLVGANYTTTPAGDASIDIESNQLQYRLLPTANTANISRTKLRGNTIKITTRTTELMLEARCVGYYSDTPDASNSGVDMAERLMVSLYDVDETAALRDQGFAINRAVVTDTTILTDGFQESVGALDAIVTTNYALITTLDNATQAPFTISGP